MVSVGCNGDVESFVNINEVSFRIGDGATEGSCTVAVHAASISITNAQKMIRGNKEDRFRSRISNFLQIFYMSRVKHRFTLDNNIVDLIKSD